MELTSLSERVKYIKGSTNVGVVILENSCVALIDSGHSEIFAKNLYELLSDYRFKITHILNTHAHADHIAANNWLQNKTNCKILAAPLETPTIINPLIQAVVLFSGAPIEDLLNRFVIAKPSKVENLPENEIIIDDLKIKIINLHGHSIEQKGFLVDGVAFLADTLFEEKFFSRQRLPYNYDPSSHIDTLYDLSSIEADCFIGGHFAPTKDIYRIRATNLNTMENSINFMYELLKVPQPYDRVVKNFMDNFNLKKSGWEHFLYRAMVNGYLSALYKTNKIKYRVLDNLLIWYSL